MSEFIERPRRVHAWKWDGDQDLARVLVDEWGMKPVPYASLRGELYFASSGPMDPDAVDIAAVGDWILTPDEGLTFFALPEDDFREMYDEVGHDQAADTHD